MEIRQLHLKHYGKFTDYRISFSPGLSIIYGDNETGKSTMHSFIRSMLYGLERQRGRAGRNDEYTLHLPWQNPGAYEGSMTVISGGRRLRIERNFLERTVRVIDEQTGQELNAEMCLEEIRSGLSEASFVNSVFLSQEKVRTDAALAEQLQHYMVNYQETGDKDLNVARAVDYLKERRRETEKQKKQEENRLAEGRREQESRIAYVKNELQELAKRRSDCEKRLVITTAREVERKQKDVLIEPDFLQRGDRVKLFFVQLLLLLVSAACFGVAALIKEKTFRVVLAFGGAIFLAAAVLLYSYRLRDRKKRKRWQAQVNAVEVMGNGRDTPTKEQEQLRWEMDRLSREIHEKEVLLGNLMDELEQPQSSDTLNALEEERQALELAIARMREISGNIYTETGGKFQQAASGILDRLTGGRYTRVSLDSSGEVRINTPDRLLNLNQVSCGTMHQIYLALRLAAGVVFEKKEPLPVILDDAFAMYDDERLEEALRLLDGCGRQVILFTCQNREKQIYERIKGGN